MNGKVGQPNVHAYTGRVEIMWVSGRLCVRVHEVPVVFLDQSTEGLDQERDEEDADTGGRHVAGRANLPAFGEEARVDCVPIPDHLFLG